MGKRWAEIFADKQKGKGTVLMVRGSREPLLDNQQASERNQ